MKLRSPGRVLSAAGVLGLAGLAGLAAGAVVAEVALWVGRRRAEARRLARLLRRNRFVAARLEKRAPGARRNRAGDCTICLERVRRRQWTRVTPCGAIFHAGCLEQWVFYAAERYLRAPREAAALPPICPNCGCDLQIVPPRPPLAEEPRTPRPPAQWAQRAYRAAHCPHVPPPPGSVARSRIAPLEAAPEVAGQ